MWMRSAVRATRSPRRRPMALRRAVIPPWWRARSCRSIGAADNLGEDAFEVGLEEGLAQTRNGGIGVRWQLGVAGREDNREPGMLQAGVGDQLCAGHLRHRLV